MTHHVIYIPGIGDHRTYGQNLAINLWRLFGFKPHYFPLTWNEETGFDAKLDRLLDFIVTLQQSGERVSLVGISAGASAVINAYAANKQVTGVVYICGKINRPESVKPSIYIDNPDFKESLALLQKNLKNLTTHDKARFLNIYPYKDQVVPYPDTKIEGVKEIRLPGWSHVQGIFSGVVLGTPYIAKFLRNVEHQST